jgi:hypothetical protein
MKSWVSTTRRVAVALVIGAAVLLFASTGIARAQSHNGPVNAVVWAPLVCANCESAFTKSGAYNIGVPIGNGTPAFVVDVGVGVDLSGDRVGFITALAGLRVNAPARCYVEGLVGEFLPAGFVFGFGGGVDIGKAGWLSVRLQAHVLTVGRGSAVYRLGIGISR